MTDNIIKFPKENKNPPPPPMPEVVDPAADREKIYKLKIDNLTMVVLDSILEQFEVSNFRFDFHSDKHLKDLALLVESIKSILHKYYDMEYPLHALVEQLFTIDDLQVRYTMSHNGNEPKNVLMRSDTDMV